MRKIISIALVFCGLGFGVYAAPSDTAVFLKSNDTLILNMGEPGITEGFSSNGTIYIQEYTEFYVQIGKVNDITATYVQITSPDKVDGNYPTYFISKVTIPGEWGFKKVIGGKTYTNYINVISYDSTHKALKASNDTICSNSRNFYLSVDTVPSALKYVWVVLPTEAAVIKDTTNEVVVVPSYAYQGKITVRAIAGFGQYSGITSKVSDPLELIVVGGGPVSEFDAITSASTKVDFTNKSTNATSYTWAFGDGQTQNVNNSDPLSHTYAAKGKVTVTLIARNNSKCPTDTLKKEVEVGKVGLITLDEAVIEIYPNPASDRLQISVMETASTMAYSIVNMNGMILKSGIVNNGSDIDITSLPSGAYVLKISNRTFTFIKR